ncbi:hypothetical protein HD806DRAFT_517357 [Xylariaceae sp. AK1471]|nr:hypothetical protein HD806DRAFT_517357 [Xylariaceae sp. AK1471]
MQLLRYLSTGSALISISSASSLSQSMKSPQSEAASFSTPVLSIVCCCLLSQHWCLMVPWSWSCLRWVRTGWDEEKWRYKGVLYANMAKPFGVMTWSVHITYHPTVI